MPVMKRKTVSALVGKASRRRSLASALDEKVPKKAPREEEEATDEEVAEQEAKEEQVEAVDEVKEELSEEDLMAQREEEVAAARRTELKATPVDALKELLLSEGLEKGKKEDMIEALLAHEARARAEVRAQEARVRAAVAGKVAELQALSVPELRERGAAMGLKGQMSKQAFVERLLKQWQDDDGIDKALAKMAQDAREAELAPMDKPALRKLCDKVGVDPFVKGVIVERLIRQEAAAGRFARPKLHELDKEEPCASGKTMVEALLASEANRKKEKELKRQREEAVAQRRLGLQEMTNEELRKLVAKKGLEVKGNKQELVEALFEASLQEDIAAARKEHLRSLSVESLQKLFQKNGLRHTGKTDAMVETFLAHETRIHEELRAFEVVVDEVLAKQKAELEAETGPRLKELCESKGVKVGVSKEERIERLLEAAKDDGEADAAAARMNRTKRTEALLARDVPSLVSLCSEKEVDPLVKEVMIERILAHESEHGPTKGTENGSVEPAAKKARKSKE